MLYVAFWGFSIYILWAAIKSGGRPNRAVRGVDMAGRVCGIDEGVKDLKFAAWPWPPLYRYKVCVADCNETLTDPRNKMALTVPSERFTFYCIPNAFKAANVSIKFGGDFAAADQAVSRAVGDVVEAYPIILAMIGVALLLSFFYTCMMRAIAGCLVWCIILVTFLAGACISAAFIYLARTQTDSASSDRVKFYWGVGITLGVVDLIFMCFIFCMCGAINVAIKVVKVAAKVLTQMKTLYIFPLFPLFLALGYLTFWVITALYLWSVGTFETVNTPNDVLYNYFTKARNTNSAVSQQFVWDETYRKFFIAHAFGLFWNLQFLAYFCYFVMAGAIAEWYFAAVDEDGNRKRGDNVNELSENPVSSSMSRTAKHHLGTIALAALFMAIIKFIRAIVAYIQAQTTSKNPNCLQKCLFGCLQCMLKCCECLMNEINEGVLIWTAIHGDNFCIAAVSSVKLKLSNLGRVAAIHAVGGFLMFVGKLFVATGATVACAAILIYSSKYKDSISTPLVPCIIVFIEAWLVAMMMMEAFDVSIDTVFMCYLIDSAHHGGNAKFATGFPDNALVQVVDEHKNESAEMHKAHMDSRRAIRGEEVATRQETQPMLGDSKV